MKKILFALGILSVALVTSAYRPGSNRRTVVYSSTVECKNCKNKVMDNIAFEKGVKDVAVDLTKQTVKIVFDDTKTDTLTLAKAIRKLGYGAKVIKYE